MNFVLKLSHEFLMAHLYEHVVKGFYWISCLLGNGGFDLSRDDLWLISSRFILHLETVLRKIFRGHLYFITAKNSFQPCVILVVLLA